jgi:hypothetical protein
LTIFQTTQAYASELTLTYDESRQLYLGQFVSRGGVYNIEGVNRADVTYEMDRLLAEEYRSMTRDVTKKSSFVEVEALREGRSRGGGGRSMGGGGNERVHTINATEARIARGGSSSALSKAATGLDLASAAMALATGNWLELAMASASLAMGEWFEGVESLWDKQPEKVFAVVFCGVLITAKSRSELMKKLIRQKNKRLEMIMNHIRHIGLSGDDPDSELGKAKRENNKIRQLRKKKEEALCFGPDKWKNTVSPQGQQTGWRARTLDLRERIKGKKANAEELWVDRVGMLAERGG